MAAFSLWLDLAIEEAKTLLQERVKLIERVDMAVDYNIEDYVRQLDELLAKEGEKITELREKVNKFEKQLEEEKIASRNIRKLHSAAPGYPRGIAYSGYPG